MYKVLCILIVSVHFILLCYTTFTLIFFQTIMNPTILFDIYAKSTHQHVLGLSYSVYCYDNFCRSYEENFFPRHLDKNGTFQWTNTSFHMCKFSNVLFICILVLILLEVSFGFCSSSSLNFWKRILCIFCGVWNILAMGNTAYMLIGILPHLQSHFNGKELEELYIRLSSAYEYQILIVVLALINVLLSELVESCCETEFPSRRKKGLFGQTLSSSTSSFTTTTGNCCICLTSPSNIALLPCGHLCLCKECSSCISKCPLCRAVPDQITQIYLA